MKQAHPIGKLSFFKGKIIGRGYCTDGCILGYVAAGCTFPPWLAFPGVFLPKNSMDSCGPPYAPPPSPRYYLALVGPTFFGGKNTQCPPPRPS
jgi:hypothetical protein